jgi:hypothetical protein
VKNTHIYICTRTKGRRTTKETRDEEDDSDIYDITRRKATREKRKTTTSRETTKRCIGEPVTQSYSKKLAHLVM